MTWTNTAGGNHEGSDWTPTDTTIIAGVHYGIGTFLITSGYTINIDTGNELKIFADTIMITGTLDGDEDGYSGGAGGDNVGGNSYGGSGDGTGRGRGGRRLSDTGNRCAGGGAGYGGTGGNGQYSPSSDSPYGDGGTVCGSASEVEISMGSGGGGGPTLVDDSGTSYGGAGGNGGAGISLYGNIITITGSISCVGENGGSVSGYHDAGGAGSGGGILIVGCTITASGTLAVDGGTGGTSTSYDNGGGGAGGRIKLIGNSTNTAGITTTITGGTGSNNGTVGSYQSVELSQCTSSIPLGQTFTIGHVDASLLTKILIWVDTVNTAGDFILKVWDSTSKSVEYASKTVTINSTGETTFEFTSWSRIPNGELQYYLELSTAGSGDINIGSYGISTLEGGDYYRNLKVVSRFDSYHKIYSVGHIKGVSVYNTSNTTVKTDVTNLMLIGSEYFINTNEFGTIQYSDNFITNKYLADYDTILNVTHDTTNDELDIADDGYITYKIDAKYPVTGIPTLTSTIDITSGTPAIQISTDGSTWYDIDSSITDNVSTIYKLDNAANLSLDQVTLFYIKINCAQAAVATCTIKTFVLDIDIIVIDIEHFIINTGAANTIRCDQDSNSGLNCIVELKYHDRSWV